MTQEEALIEAQAIFPGKADNMWVERKRNVGFRFGSPNEFRIWSLTPDCDILASSDVSWEHCLAVARAKAIQEADFAVDDSPVEEPLAQG